MGLVNIISYNFIDFHKDFGKHYPQYKDLWNDSDHSLLKIWGSISETDKSEMLNRMGFSLIGEVERAYQILNTIKKHIHLKPVVKEALEKYSGNIMLTFENIPEHEIYDMMIRGNMYIKEDMVEKDSDISGREDRNKKINEEKMDRLKNVLAGKNGKRKIRSISELKSAMGEK